MIRVLYFVYGVLCHLLFLAVYGCMAAFFGGFPLLPKTVDSPAGRSRSAGRWRSMPAWSWPLACSTRSWPGRGSSASGRGSCRSPSNGAPTSCFSCLCLIGTDGPVAADQRRRLGLAGRARAVGGVDALRGRLADGARW